MNAKKYNKIEGKNKKHQSKPLYCIVLCSIVLVFGLSSVY